jgi:hypothetical protein
MYLDAYSFSVMPIESISLWTEMQSRLQIGHDVSMNVPYGCIFLNSDNGTAYLNGSEIATINQIPDVTVFPVNGENDSDIEMTRYGAGISSHIMLRPNGAYIQSHDSSTDSYSSVETHPTGGVRIVAEGSMKALYNNSEILTLASGDSRYLYYGYGNAGGSIALDDDLYFVVDSGTGKHRAAQIRKDAIAFVTHNDEWGVDNAIELIDSGIFLSDQVGQCHIAVRKNGNIHLNTTDGTAYYNNSEILTESSGLHYGQDNAGGEIVVENSLDLGINSDAGKHRTIQFRKHCIAITTHNDEWHVDNAISVDDGGIGLFDLVGQNEISIYRNGNIYIGTPDGKAYYNNNEIATVNLFAALEARITALESTT